MSTHQDKSLETFKEQVHEITSLCISLYGETHAQQQAERITAAAQKYADEAADKRELKVLERISEVMDEAPGELGEYIDGSYARLAALKSEAKG